MSEFLLPNPGADTSRRNFLKKAALLTLGTGIIAQAPLVAPSPAYASVPVRPRVRHLSESRALFLYNTNTRERIRTVFYAHGRYDKRSFNHLCYFLRDSHDHSTHWMDPRLLTMLHDMQTIFDGREIQIISAYRSPRTNARIRAARNSYHIRGQAVDLRIPGISTHAIREVAKTLRVGGVGYYPRSRFVHVDTGPVRTW